MGQFHFGDFAHFPIGANIISLMRDAMLRVSEAAALSWSDITSEADGTGTPPDPAVQDGRRGRRSRRVPVRYNHVLAQVDTESG